MAQDLKNLFEDQSKEQTAEMSTGHEARFLQKLDKALPKQKKTNRFGFLNIAASVVVLLGLSYGAYQFISSPNTGGNTIPEEEVTRSIGDVSPELKKVEDYYLASINLELSKLQIAPENKELFDGYLSRIKELTQEYKLLSDEFIDAPNEQTADAIINNLKLRLDLMYRLKEKLSELRNTESIL
ncbi:hypothetical protein [Winogradskyella immobilis]|uniref:Uncharacterized protein n=1 Tax=Winogradskyella immobilis TaxID=2816852 RepID=A0ABS8ER07_9FLAO|nr:hypothetical protein [Winogradskyella immobilis]MCC1485432.1 hypothetical protein [Winogradskyella immobilis]MCG0017524.1 hypothetical protein [Winogradskyella immobilis]